MRLKLTNSAPTLAILFLTLLLAGAAFAAEPPCPCPPPPPPPPPLWTGSIGFSYLATSGNTDTRSLGLAAGFKRQPTPWGAEVTALANRAETNGSTTAERLFGGLRGVRALSDSFDLFAGASYERDRFAGFDRRIVVEAGGLWHVLKGPSQELAFDAGATWTTKDPVGGSSDNSVGALAGVIYAWKFASGAVFRERAIYYPNFSHSEAWRMRSETSIEASLAAAWALRLSYLYTRDNQPTPGFKKADATTAVSLVWKR